MQTTIHIQAKMIGAKLPLLPDWDLPLPPEMSLTGSTTLRDLITLLVEREVGDFRERQAGRRFARLLTKAGIENAAAGGKVDVAARSPQVKEVKVVLEEAVASALTAFQDGLYYVFIDDTQIETLDQPVLLQPESRITFLRLVPLAGG